MITPAAEWLVDNFHIAEEQIREIHEDLPIGYYRELPKLAGGPHASYPRVFGIAWDFVAHTDSHFEPETLLRFVRAYQTVQALTIGELWAVPITLRVVLVENLRRLAQGMIFDREAIHDADQLADKLIGLDGDPAEGDQILRKTLARELQPQAFTVRLLQRLRDQDPESSSALLLLNHYLHELGTSAEESVRSAHQAHGAMNVTVRNVITSMRQMSVFDWNQFFEDVSLVNQELRGYPIFPQMDFPTRDRYLHAVEDLARGSHLPEIEIARRALAKAEAAGPDSTPSRGDPGHYLIASGRIEFERDLRSRPSLTCRLLRVGRAWGVLTYLGSIGLVTSGILAIPLVIQGSVAPDQGRLLWILGLLALIPASEIAISLVNRAVVSLFKPHRLPKLEVKDEIPGELRTMVVVPTMLTSESEIAEQIERLEVHYLANSEKGLTFALLTDWTDAAAESLPADNDLLDFAAKGIARLNAAHGPLDDEAPRFFLLHRRRLWNSRERKWIGWERKRGKLHELNRLLRGATDTTFIPISGVPPHVPEGVRYITTLDADTRIPRGTVCSLIGAMAHPLGRPRVDPVHKRVVEGHAVLQPRITTSLPRPGENTLFRRIFSGPVGIDPYASAVSEVYQDLFDEGSYAGKGIYEVDAFEEVLAGRVPENAILSHDLFEGIFARAGFATDIELVEDFPESYEVAAARQHRWVRGDWQLLPWILGLARDAHGRLRRARIPAIGRWKMIDNLRRSLAPPAAVATLIAAWTLPLSLAGLWTGFIVGSLAIPSLLPVLDALLPRRKGISKRSHILALGRDFATAIGKCLTTLALLAHQAWLMIDAIGRTLTRLFLTKRHLLEWVTAAQAGARFDLSVAGLYRRFAWVVAMSVAAGAITIVLNPSDLAIAATFLLAWTGSPLLARWISLPLSKTMGHALTDHEVRLIRATARETWRFFDTLVTDGENHLPPDNVQLDPKPETAHRTSPTNVGLYLLSTVAARDFGWIGATEMVSRLEATVATLFRLERMQGHFFNWYDTLTLRPLEPRYVSSVDSGNLAGHLLTMAQACREIAGLDPLGSRALAGIEDAALLLRQTARAAAAEGRTHVVTGRQIDEAIEGLLTVLRAPPGQPEGWAKFLAALSARAGALVDMVHTLAIEGQGTFAEEAVAWSQALRATIASHARDLPMASALPLRLATLARAADEMAMSMDFGFLYDRSRKLFAIGFRADEGRLDGSHYDLLASEARLTSYLAIAKGDAPTEHWFKLSRPLTPIARGSALVSWSGSMFEYLMPALVMDFPPESLLDQTYRLVVQHQINFGADRGVPWGISESAFSARDLSLTYQYSNFGVPGLGLKRGLAENTVVSPYSTALAAMIDPVAAVENFERLAGEGAHGAYGFFEALDFTPARVPEKSTAAVVKAYMSHHQGMTLVALDNVLGAGIMRSRFHATPMVKSAELLLQERTPRDLAVARPRAEEVSSDLHVRDLVPPVLRRFTSASDPTPRSHLLSNGHYAVMMTAAGSGYSRSRRLAVTRWREDVTRDSWGTWIYLRDSQSGDIWSAGHQPTGSEAEGYEAVFSEDRVEIRRRDREIACAYSIVVSPESDAEIRRVSLTNHSARARQIELTSYAEIVLTEQAADDAHPAFNKLFVQTEFSPENGALLASRRPRSDDEARVWAAHAIAINGEAVGSLQYETDRSRFVGRGRSVRNPVSVTDGRPLSNTVGSVLDPIFCFRVRVRIAPGATAHVAFTTLIATTREEALASADKHRDVGIFDRILTLAWTQAQVQLRHLDIAPDEAHLFQRLANRILYSDPTLRPPGEVIKRCAGGMSALWRHGISGDLPIVLLRIEEPEEREIVRQVLRAHEYWRMKGLAVDLVILNERAASYDQDLQASVESMARAAQVVLQDDNRAGSGRIFILRADLISPEERDVLRATARAVLMGRNGTLAEQLVRTLRIGSPKAAPAPRQAAAEPSGEPPAEIPDLEFFNGLGGFGKEGREYVIVLGEGQWTPAPWINVIANPEFGFQVSEAGSGYTWSGNSRENQLTSWSNDPVADPASEAIYVRDEESGAVWTPTALPIREVSGAYIARHGQGYSIFQRSSHGIALELIQFVPLDAPIKISRLTIENPSPSPRRLSITGFVEWALGPPFARTAPFIVTEFDAKEATVFARNAWSADAPERAAFFAVAGARLSPSAVTATCDRTEFLGRNGSPDQPAAMLRAEPLSGRSGAGLDPCAALRCVVEIPAGGRKDVVFLLGQESSKDHALALLGRYRAAEVAAEIAKVREHWDDVLGTIVVRTPDRSLDLIVNRWLLYQALSCRIWARSAFYQAGGAYGFRDQLQDVLAMLPARPALVREHLLRSAARQFVEGDVQHWWHPQTGRGVRTRITDDRLWLPYVAAEYIRTTGDHTLLDERVAFLDGPPLGADDAESYFQPGPADRSGSMFEHCARAIEISLRTGSHGLPLIGTGDWNDGLNRVGREGRGESVWLGWFLITVIEKLAPLARARGEVERAQTWTTHALDLKQALEREGWDGDWYRRAFFDDGTPIGSAGNSECRIDSIAQSWSVISQAAQPGRAARAMAAVEEHLVRRGDSLALLFTPPFDRTAQDPGYIKGYVPGVRENGGQYTHAAVWSVIAFAMLGLGERATELFALINPINDTSTRAGVHRYKVEPYVAAADVYSEYPHTGRGGWTWYTGAAGWMYRAAIESILGFRIRAGDREAMMLSIDPVIPRAWRDYEIRYRHGGSLYTIQVENPRGANRGVTSIELDGRAIISSDDLVTSDVPEFSHVALRRGQDSEPSGETAAATGEAAAGPREGSAHAGIRDATPSVRLVDDGAEHTIRVVIG